MKLPDNNPKTRYGVRKPGLAAVSPYALLQLGLVMKNGADKYGAFNYREVPVTESTYYDAAMRHLMSWWDGETTDLESGLPHLAHVMACCTILLDTERLGMLQNDRPRVMGAVGTFIRDHAQRHKETPDVTETQEPATTEPVNDERDREAFLDAYGQIKEEARNRAYTEQPWKRRWKEGW